MEDGCINYQGKLWCFCSTDYCNAKNISSIRGKDDCSVNSCPDGSECFDTYDSYKCICPPWDQQCAEMSVKSCHEGTCVRDCCSVQICFNGGFCQKQANGVCRCVCPVGYSGASCEICDCCQTFVCQNNGVCENNAGVCSCRCPTGEF